MNRVLMFLLFPNCLVSDKRVLNSVSLISTIYNEADNIKEFLDSVVSQTVLPSEYIIVDAGSTDGTLDVLRDYAEKYPWIKVYVVPGIDIGGGRNEAIRRASGSVIAVTDAGCVLDKHWLERITKPILDGRADVVVGAYEPLARNEFELFQGAVSTVPKEEIPARPSRWSSRSIAFRRQVWESVGGYPPFRTGEDTNFNIKVLEAGFKIFFEPDAVVFWRVCPSWRAFFRQFYRYGYGDAKTGNLFKLKGNLLLVAGFWAYLLALLLSAVVSPLLFAVLLVPAVGYAVLSGYRVYRRTGRLKGFLYGAVFQTIKRIAYVLGATRGLF